MLRRKQLQAQSPSDAPTSPAPQLIIEPLAPRILLSADLPGLDLLADRNSETLSDTNPDRLLKNLVDTHAGGEAGDSTATAVREIVLVDTRVGDYQQLIDDIVSAQADKQAAAVYTVVLIDQGDSLEAITDKLSGDERYSAVHLVTHGTSGAFQLGNTWFSQLSVGDHQQQFERWSSSLTDSADILLYGCDLADSAAGRELLNTLSGYTGADVAASDDLTGHASLGGDWDFEYRLGEIESRVAFSDGLRSDWEGVLEVIQVTTSTDELNGDTSSIANLQSSPGGDGISLREAIIAAENTAGDDLVELSAETYVLSLTGTNNASAASGDLDIGTSITLAGSKDGTTTLSASGLGDRVFDVDNSGSLSLSNLVITGAESTDAAGGAIRSTGVLHAVGVELQGNTAAGAGGAIAIGGGSVYLESVTVVGNEAERGGGISLSNSTSVDIIDSAIRDNTADLQGGGIMLSSGAALIHGSTISGNSSGNGGGVIVSGGSVMITHSTISSNHANFFGGGIGTAGLLNLQHVTVAKNTSTGGSGGSGVHVYSGTFTTSNSLFADNERPSVASDINGAINSQGYNLIEYHMGFSGQTSDDIIGVDPGLAPLADNGGAQQTHAIDQTSAAFDAGTGSAILDQRGVARDSRPDIGAYERVVPPLTETLVNVTTNSLQQTNGNGGGNIASDAAGNYVLTWTSYLNGHDDVFARLYGADGLPRSGEFRINTHTASDQYQPAVAMDSAGDFVVAWTSASQDDSGSRGVFGRRFDASGTALGAEFQVNLNAGGDQNNPAVAMDEEGNFTISYSERPYNGGDVYHRRYSADGTPLTVGERTHQDASGDQHYSDIAIDGNTGQSVIVFQRDDGGGNGEDSQHRRFDSNGDAFAAETRATAVVLRDQIRPKVDYAADGSYVVSWTGQNSDNDIYYRLYNADGSARSIDLQANTYTTIDQEWSDLSVRDDGEFFIAWKSEGQDSDDGGIYAQRFDANGVKVGGEIRVSDTWGGDQYGVSVDFNDDRVVFVWSGTGAGDGSGVFQKLIPLSEPAPLDTITVTTWADENDGDTSSLSALDSNPGGTGISLREAILAVNNTDDITVESIEFQLPNSGAEKIELLSALPAVQKQVTIDGWSDPAYNGDGIPSVVIDGSGLFGASGLHLAAGSDGSVVRGLSLSQFDTHGVLISSSNNQVYGNFVAVDETGMSSDGGNTQYGIRMEGGASNNTIGTNSDGNNDTNERNIVSGTLSIVSVNGESADGNVIAGNFVGIGYDGKTVVSESLRAVVIEGGADDTLIGGTSSVSGNTIYSANGFGVSVTGESTDGTVIDFNRIGVSSDNTTLLENSGVGIGILSGADDSIVRNNHLASGVRSLSIDGASDGTLVAGNRIGTDSSGELDWGTLHDSINISGNASNTQIGGIAPGESNVIAYSAQTGIYVDSTVTGATIRGNAIYGHAGQGIDLIGGDSGHDINDAGDADTGGNNKQNWPVLGASSISNTGTLQASVDGTTLSANSPTYTLDLYLSNKLYDGRAQGERYVASESVTSGQMLNINLGGITASPGEYLTLLVTDANGNTSEFSNYSVVTAADAGVAADPQLHVVALDQGGLTINADGSNAHYLEAENGSHIMAGLSSLTFEIDFSSQNNTGADTFIEYGSSPQKFLVRMNADDSILVRIEDESVSFNAANYRSILYDGERHSLAVTWNQLDGKLELYIDGQSMESASSVHVGSALSLDAEQLVIGYGHDDNNEFHPSESFSGTLHAVRIFSDVRQPHELAASYRDTLPHDEPDLRAQWRFDQLPLTGVIADSVSANNLHLKQWLNGHTSSQSPWLSLEVYEGAPVGTPVATLQGNDTERAAEIASILSRNPLLVYSAETDHFYQYWAGSGDFPTAESNAANQLLNGVGASLASVHSAAENAALLKAYTLADASGPAWLGGSDREAHAQWRWLSPDTEQLTFWYGEDAGYHPEIAYENFSPGEPNHTASSANYLLMDDSGQWQDGTQGSASAALVKWNADEVLDQTQPLVYAIESQSVIGAFTIDESTGEITVANSELLNHEFRDSQQLMISVSNADGQRGLLFISIDIKDIAESSTLITGLGTGVELNVDGGNNAYFQAADGGALLGGLSSFTAEIAFSTESAGKTTLMSYVGGAVLDDLALTLEVDGTASFVVANNTIAALDGMDYNSLRDGRLHDIALSWDNTAGSWALYVDGALVDSGTGLSAGATLEGNPGTGSLVFGQEQDASGGSFDPDDQFAGVLYDIRLWNEVRRPDQILGNLHHRLTPGQLPTSLIANWHMSVYNGLGEIVDVVNGNNLSEGHVWGSGFSPSNATSELHVDQYATDGIPIGYVRPEIHSTSNTLLADGSFLEGVANRYTSGQTFGSWSVLSGEVVLQSSAPTPAGENQSVEFSGSSPAAFAQSFTTEPGRQYQVVFSFSGNFDQPELVKDLRVAAAGHSQVFSSSEPSGWTAQAPVWTPAAFMFTATQSSTELSFTSLDSGDHGPIIADVAVVEIDKAVTDILNADSTLFHDAATGKFYRVVTASANATDAAAFAAAAQVNGVSGQLATIRSPHEHQLIRDAIDGSAMPFYLGGSDAETEGNWRWMSATASSDTFWSGTAVAGAYSGFDGAPEPDGGSSENVLVIGEDGVWRDASGQDAFGYVVEWDADEVVNAEKFEYSLTDSAGGRFAIDQRTGELRVWNGSLLSEGAAVSHTVDVRVEHADGDVLEQSVVITVDRQVAAVQSVPPAQTMDEDTSLTFSAGNGNALLVGDSDAGTDAVMQVELEVSQGSLTLPSMNGLTLIEGANGNSSIAFSGTESTINNSLDGAVFTPDPDFHGPVSLSMSTSILSGLQGHYTFDDGTAGDQNPGTDNTGTLQFGASVVTDPERGEVLRVTGDDDSVAIPTLYGEPENVTIAAWVNVTGTGDVVSLGNNVFLRLNDPNGSNGVAMYFYDGTYHSRVGGGDFLSGTGWRHVAATFDDATDTQRVYLDGKLVASANVSSSIDYSYGSGSVIGNDVSEGLAHDLDGLIDDVQVYAKALSSHEVAALALDVARTSDEVPITVNNVYGNVSFANHVMEDTPGSLVLSALDLTGLDGGVDPLTVTFTTLAGGTLTAVSGNGVSVGGTPDILSLTGSSADLRNWLETPDSIQYLHGSAHTHGDGADEILVIVRDSHPSTPMSRELANIAIHITAVNDAPEVSAPVAVLSAEERAPLAIQGEGFELADVDAESALIYAQMSVTEGILHVVPGDSGAELISGNGTATVEFEGSAATLNALVNGSSTGTIVYFNGSNNPSSAVTISLLVNDRGYTGVDPGNSADASSEQAVAVQQIQVAAVNSAPEFLSFDGRATVELSIDEGQSTVATLSAIDADNNDTLSYSVEGADNAHLLIDSATGELRFSLVTDFENPTDPGQDGLYQIEIRATDSEGEYDSQFLNVRIGNVNEAPEQLSLSNQSVDENTDSTAGLVIGTLTAADPDGAGTITYTLTGGDDVERFSLTGEQSDRLVLSDGLLDAERQDRYEVVVRATDAEGLSAQQAFSITINDIVEKAVINGDTASEVVEDRLQVAGAPLRASGALVVNDPEGGDTRFTPETIQGQYGSLSIAESGQWEYTADNTQPAIQSLGAEDTLTETLQVSTQSGLSQSIVIRVVGEDDPAIVSGDTRSELDSSQSLTQSGVLAISDIDTSDNPIWFPDQPPMPGDNGLGVFSMVDNRWTYTLDSDSPALAALSADTVLNDGVWFAASDGSRHRVELTILADATVAPIEPTEPAEPAVEPAQPAGAAAIPPVIEMAISNERPPDSSGSSNTEAPSATGRESANNTGEEQNPNQSAGQADPAGSVSANALTDELVDFPQPLPVNLDNTILAGPEEHVRRSAPDSPVNDSSSVALSRSQILLELQDTWDQNAIAFDRQILEQSRAHLDRSVTAIDQQFDEVEDSHVEEKTVTAQVAAGLGFTLAAGYVTWMTQAGSMVASLLASMPVWRQFDPLPILGKRALELESQLGQNAKGDLSDGSVDRANENTINELLD